MCFGWDLCKSEKQKFFENSTWDDIKDLNQLPGIGYREKKKLKAVRINMTPIDVFIIWILNGTERFVKIMANYGISKKKARKLAAAFNAKIRSSTNSLNGIMLTVDKDHFEIKFSPGKKPLIDLSIKTGSLDEFLTSWDEFCNCSEAKDEADHNKSRKSFVTKKKP